MPQRSTSWFLLLVAAIFVVSRRSRNPFTTIFAVRAFALVPVVRRTCRSSSSSSMGLLKSLTPSQVGMEQHSPVNPQALEQATAIWKDLCPSGSSTSISSRKLVEIASRFGDIAAKDDASDESRLESRLLVSKEDCRNAYDGLDPPHRDALNRIHARVKVFAEAQRASLTDMEREIPGGKAGHTVRPCGAAGCYAPGGRYPLPSSVIMTAVTARAAGCQTVVLCSPKPQPITLAAAHLAGVDCFLPIGGAQAICAMAKGVSAIHSPACDVIVGPGNQWVTAAKSMARNEGTCGIDMLAGPSEVLVICDETASPCMVAADLIAQAEHDVVARAILVGTDAALLNAIDEEVEKQVLALPEPNQSTAKAALTQSFSVLCESMDECVDVSNRLAPEHLELQCRNVQEVAAKCRHYGGLFIGSHAAEVLGDYGAGPNHTLPTGGTGRYTGGLSVFDFLAIRTWMRIDAPAQAQEMVKDSVIMARLEGLEGHARAAEARLEK